MITTKDIAWLAGLLEGEGSFQIAQRSIMIAVQMTDRDIIQRVADLCHTKVGGPYTPLSRPNCKPAWYIRFYGAHAASWMMTIYCLMGDRRQLQIKNCLDYWKSQKRKRYNVRDSKGHSLNKEAEVV